MERMWIEYQRINWKEYVSLRRYYNLLCKCKALEEENKSLKDKIEFLTNCLDDRDKSIELMKEENKKLKDKIEYYKKQCGED